MTRAHRVDAVIEPDRSVRVAGLPFLPGDRVEMIILAEDVAPAKPVPENHYPLRGTPYRFEDPFSPATDPDEWDANW